MRIVQAKAGREKAPVATAFIALAQALGIMLALVLSGAIFHYYFLSPCFLSLKDFLVGGGS